MPAKTPSQESVFTAMNSMSRYVAETAVPMSRTRRRSLMRTLKLSAAGLTEWEDALPGFSIRTDRGAKLFLDKLTGAGMKPKDAKAYREVKFNPLHREDVEKLFAAGVRPSYLRDLDNTSVTESVHDIIRLHAAGIPAVCISGHAASADEMLGLYGEGVPAEYFAALFRAGAETENITAAWRAGISVEFAVAAAERAS